MMIEHFLNSWWVDMTVPFFCVLSLSSETNQLDCEHLVIKCVWCSTAANHGGKIDLEFQTMFEIILHFFDSFLHRLSGACVGFLTANTNWTEVRLGLWHQVTAPLQDYPSSKRGLASLRSHLIIIDLVSSQGPNAVEEAGACRQRSNPEGNGYF